MYTEIAPNPAEFPFAHMIDYGLLAYEGPSVNNPTEWQIDLSIFSVGNQDFCKPIINIDDRYEDECDYCELCYSDHNIKDFASHWDCDHKLCINCMSSHLDFLPGYYKPDMSRLRCMWGRKLFLREIKRIHSKQAFY